MNPPFNNFNMGFVDWSFKFDGVGSGNIIISFYQANNILPALYIDMNSSPTFNPIINTMWELCEPAKTIIHHIPIVDVSLASIYSYIHVDSVPLPLRLNLENPYDPVLLDSTGKELELLKPNIMPEFEWVFPTAPLQPNQPGVFPIDENVEAQADPPTTVAANIAVTQEILEDVSPVLGAEVLAAAVFGNINPDGDFFAAEELNEFNPAAAIADELQAMVVQLDDVIKEPVPEGALLKNDIAQTVLPHILTMFSIPILNCGSSDFDYATNNMPPNELQSKEAFLNWSMYYGGFYSNQEPLSFFVKAADYFNNIRSYNTTNRSALIDEGLMNTATITQIDKLQKANHLADDSIYWGFFAGTRDDLRNMVYDKLRLHHGAPDFYLVEMANCFIDIFSGLGLLLDCDDGLVMFHPVSLGTITSLTNQNKIPDNIPEYVDDETKERMYLSLIRMNNIHQHFLTIATSNHIGYLKTAYMHAYDEVSSLKSKENAVIELVNPYTWS